LEKANLTTIVLWVMLTLVGIDAVDLNRFTRLITSVNGLSSRVFTPNERSYSSRSLAGNFAAKEAVRKALWDYKQLDFTEIEITRNTSGRPVVNLMLRSSEFTKVANLIKIDLSLTYQPNLSIAVAVVSMSSAKISREQ
jgi:holo-[acyl-carrier protein] synthase